MKYKIDMPPNANVIIHALQDAGYKAYIVGGCVRDSLMNRVPHDWDICTSARPEQMLEVFKDHRVIETGLQHGTVTVVIDGEQYECTSFRIDGVYSDNRRPDSVTFIDDLTEDLRRRDFTINAMAYNDEEGLIDPFDGMGDIKHGIIRCVGNAADRFNEDALRILRAIRFAAQLDFAIENNTSSELCRQRKSLANISAERITNELNKIVISDRFAGMLIKYLDIFEQFIPELEDMNNFPQNNPHHIYDVLIHTFYTVISCQNDLILRLAALFHDIGKPHSYQDEADGIRHFVGHNIVGADMTDKIMRRLKYDNNTRNAVVQLVLYHDSSFIAKPSAVKRWLNKVGEIQLKRLIDLRRADIEGQRVFYDREKMRKIDDFANVLNQVLEEQQCFSLKDLAINGDDLIALGFVPGKELGEVLTGLLNSVTDDALPNDRETLLKEAQKWLK
jgi:tRNA nucleotidyltransferase (CCA-adding enzyme)|nr:MAG TPA: Nucleotidyltransferase [Caudoviricetes sp.]